MKILLIDNAKDVRELITSLLERWGHQVAIANNNVEALQMVRKHNIQLVIGDGMKSESNGLELCHELCSSELEQYVYLIVLSEKLQKQHVAESMSTGADDYIYKPFKNQTLEAKIKSAEKVIEMENQLGQKNRLVQQAHKTIKDSYSKLELELTEMQDLPGNAEIIVLSSKKGTENIYLYISHSVSGLSHPHKLYTRKQKLYTLLI